MVSKKLDEKTIEKIKKQIFYHARRGETILLNVEDNEQRDELVDVVTLTMMRVGGGGASIPLIYNLDDKTPGEIIEILKQWGSTNTIQYPALWLNSLNRNVYVANDDIRVFLKKLKGKFSNEYNHPYYPIAIIISFTHCKVPDKFREDFEGEFVEVPKEVGSRKKGKIKEKVSFGDVNLEITVDPRGHPLFDALVSVCKGEQEKLPLEDRFIEPLYLLAKTVKDDNEDGWVYNEDLKRTCSEEVNQITHNIIKAFKKVIGKRAKDIISKKHGVAKKLNIPKKNIKLKPTK